MSSSAVTGSVGEPLQLRQPWESDVDDYCRRLEVLEQVGYRGAVAHMLAENKAIDLQEACQLKARGCTDSAAYAILFPPAGTWLNTLPHGGARRRY
jgi:hypothetical protein